MCKVGEIVGYVDGDFMLCNLLCSYCYVNGGNFLVVNLDVGKVFIVCAVIYF